MPSFKFDTTEERNAFVDLLSLIPRRQTWDDVARERHPVNNTCHICNGNISVKLSIKSGIVPIYDSFENIRSNSYAFWSCCALCHEKGWRLPYWGSRRGGMRYWRIGPANKTEECIITDFPIFKFPLIGIVGLDTVSVSI